MTRTGGRRSEMRLVSAFAVPPRCMRSTKSSFGGGTQRSSWSPTRPSTKSRAPCEPRFGACHTVRVVRAHGYRGPRSLVNRSRQGTRLRRRSPCCSPARCEALPSGARRRCWRWSRPDSVAGCSRCSAIRPRWRTRCNSARVPFRARGGSAPTSRVRLRRSRRHAQDSLASAGGWPRSLCLTRNSRGRRPTCWDRSRSGNKAPHPSWVTSPMRGTSARSRNLVTKQRAIAALSAEELQAVARASFDTDRAVWGVVRGR